MKLIEFGRFRQFILNNEGETWDKLQRLRVKFEKNHLDYFKNLPIESTEQAIESGQRDIKQILSILENLITLQEIQPGHGIGHLCRDYLHSLILAKDPLVDPRHRYIGLIAGTLHDILGLCLVERYQESKRVIRHAEAGALLFLELSKKIDMDKKTAILISYAIAAHTNYLSDQSIECSDGITRTTHPYLEIDKKANPIWAIHLTRWADRLDILGPNYLGRHYLTLIKDHEDYEKHGFFTINYQDHMRPLLRIEDEIKADPNGPTLREHLSLRTDGKNQTPYEKYDLGLMLNLRNKLKAGTLQIIDAFDAPLTPRDEHIAVFQRFQWYRWLDEKVEPSKAGKKATDILAKKFSELDQETKSIWYNVMESVFAEYYKWSLEIYRKIEDLSIKELELPLIGDPRRVLH